MSSAEFKVFAGGNKGFSAANMTLVDANESLGMNWRSVESSLCLLL